MRNFCLKLIGFGLIQAVLVIWHVYVTPSDRDGYLASVIDKHRALQAAVPPRLILVGGSNVAFGFDSSALAEPFKRAPVNMALNAGLGADYILNEPLQYLLPGDVILVSMEYRHFGGMRLAHMEMLELVRLRPQSLEHFPWQQRRGMLDASIYHWSQRVQATKRWLITVVRGSRGRPRKTVYRRSSVNAVGDVVGHYPLDRRLAPDFELPLDVDSATIAHAIEQLNAFAHSANSVGAEVLFTYPCIPQSAYDRFEQPIDAIAEAMSRHADFPIIDAPEDRVLPLEYFFDSPYHLTYEGVLWRTRQVQACLSQHIEPAAPEIQRSKSE